jgi:hypothetical protein
MQFINLSIVMLPDSMIVRTVDINTSRSPYLFVSLKSTVGIAKVGTKSLRATVPEGIVAFLGIQEGDKLEWKMDIRDGERVAIVRKTKEVKR